MTQLVISQCPGMDEPLPPEFSEIALSSSFIEQNGHQLRYVAAWGKWLIWDGSCWRFDVTLYAFDLARRTCRAAAAECAEYNEHNIAKRIASTQTVAAVERLAKADRRVAATVEQWDADPWLLNTPRGVVDVRTGIMRKHNPMDYMTKITSTAPGGACPVWEQFLTQVTAGDNELIAYLRRKAGYSLTGSTKEHDLDFLYGTGGNGKGVFLNTLTGIMNSYAAVANIDTFTVSNGDKHPTDLAMLRGARLVTAQETEEGRRWAESRIKALTGGDPITARFMRQDFFTFTPQFKLIIAGNHKPSLRNVDEAIRRRFHLVPFAVTIPKNERDMDLLEKLKTEWPGILQWAIQGAKEWQEKGLNPPKVIRDATEAYLAAEDTMESWLGECCERGKVYAVTISDLFTSWKQWCDAAGESPGTMKGFSQNLRAKLPGLPDWQCPTTRRHGLQGIRIIKSVGSD